MARADLQHGNNYHQANAFRFCGIVFGWGGFTDCIKTENHIFFCFTVAEATKSAITFISNSIAGGTQEQQVLGGEGTEFELDCRNK